MGIPLDNQLQGAPRNNAALTTGQTVTDDVDCSGCESLLVFWRLRATVTTADLSAYVTPFLPKDEASIWGVGALLGVGTAAAAWGSDVYQSYRYDVRGVDKARITTKNNNAGTKNCDVYYYLDKPGSAGA